MLNILTIPKKLLQKGELVIVPRADYEDAIQIKRRLLWEEKDTDDAIAIFEKERGEGLLRKTSSFSSVLGNREARTRTKRQ